MPPSPLGPGGKVQCVSYAPFRAGQTPLVATTRIARWQIDDDLSRLKTITDCVRTYSIQHGLDQIPELARRHGMKVIQGIWLSSNPDSNRREIDATIALAKQYPDVVQALIVGNEVLLRGEIAGPDLAAIVRDVKARANVPVTYADVWEFWIRHREIYDAVDFVTIHILPYWEDFPIPAERAVAHVDAIRRKMVAAFPDKEILLGETGFPSRGRMREGALPSPANQALVVHGIVALAKRDGFRYNLIEAFDQPWKRHLEGTVGGYWGLFDAYERRQKFGWGEAVSNHPHWRWQALGGVLVAALVFAAAWRCRRHTAALRDWSMVFAAAVVAGIMAGLTAERVPIDSFDAGGWMRNTALAAVSLLAPLVGAAALMRGDAIPPLAHVLARAEGRLRDPLALALGLVLAALILLALQPALALVFDPRYREFPYAPLTSAVVPYLLLSLRAGARHGRRAAAETLAAAALSACALYVVLNESTANWQSLWFCAAIAALAIILFRTRESDAPD